MEVALAPEATFFALYAAAVTVCVALSSVTVMICPPGGDVNGYPTPFVVERGSLPPAGRLLGFTYVPSSADPMENSPQQVSLFKFEHVPVIDV